MTDMDKKLLPTEFEGLESNFESFLNEGSDEAVNVLEQGVGEGAVLTPPTPVQRRVEASSTIRKAKKLVPAGWSGLRRRIIRKVLRKVGIVKAPPISDLFRGKVGEWVKINEISLFTSQPEDELLEELAKECCLELNRVGFSGIVEKRMIEVGIQILRCGRMYTPIHVIQVPDGALECVGGRHRLVFFALMYGGDCKVPVYLESATLDEARHAVSVANDNRPVKALEHAEHAALSAVGGNIDAQQEELYRKISRSKNNIKKYCVYSVVKRGYPVCLTFGASQVPSPVGSDLTTVSNLESYWGASLEWDKDMSREVFDKTLTGATVFINRFAGTICGLDGFNPKQHMSAKALIVVGMCYKAFVKVNDANFFSNDYIRAMAEYIVKGDILHREEGEIFIKLVDLVNSLIKE